MSIEVLLSTYNGEKYLGEFLDSLLSQTHDDFKVLVRDDGSSDDTIPIIEHYKEKFAGRMIQVSEPDENVGPSRSFSSLMMASTADYVLFADQDDVWLPNKIQLLYVEMQEQESKHPDAPILVQCDLEVVDEKLNCIAPSFWEFQGLNPTRNRLADIVMQNTVTGCAVMLNRKLVTRVKGVPESAIMHDWWIALVAAAFGYIVSVPVSLIRYRQHGLNSVGAKKYGLLYVLGRFFDMCSRRGVDNVRQSLERVRKQAESFLREYGTSLCSDDRLLLERFIMLPSMTWFGRRYFLLKNGMFKHGLVRNLGLFLSI